MLLPLSIPSPSWSSFVVGPFTIHAYALCILFGMIVAVLMSNARLTRRGAERWVVLDIGFWAIVLGIIGARAYHVLSHPFDYFGEGKNLWDVFAIWQGGIAIFGALIGGSIGALIGCRIAGIRFFSFADAVVPGVLLAQACGRFGNYFNHELFGVPTTLPWGLQIESTNPAFPTGLPAGTLFQPTFLYEIIWNLAGVALMLALDRRFQLRWGRMLAVYLVWYGIGRSYFESIRIDPSEVYLGVRLNIWAAWAAILLGLIIWIISTREHKGVEISPYRRGRGPRASDGSDDGVSSEDSDSRYVVTDMTTGELAGSRGDSAPATS